ncbi:rhodanese-like domain-containing protein [Candidatus Williamhamiltonella defendens]|uniref:rhodanese-like domain-containing protein n=1 Tax=Candidatus Williamhamiltonella defendens TaxID=138072 RepID=UPI00130D8A37|nr:rhodanese-like domain-containing protein [Candidatus Hamiltonella defensa]
MLQELVPFIDRHPILSVTWVTLLVGVTLTFIKNYFSKVKEIIPTEAILMMNKQQALVVDIRAKEEYRKSHIIGSINVEKNNFKNNKSYELEKHKARPIIIVCAHGVSSLTFAKQLYKMDFQKIYSLKEGISGWNKANLPLAKSKSK